jgi:hypothetical protein
MMRLLAAGKARETKQAEQPEPAPIEASSSVVSTTAVPPGAGSGVVVVVVWANAAPALPAKSRAARAAARSDSVVICYSSESCVGKETSSPTLGSVHPDPGHDFADFG